MSYGDDNDVYPDPPDWWTPEVAQAINQARTDEREQCCRDVCEWCSCGIDAYTDDNVLRAWWHNLTHPHGMVTREECAAGEIRERWEKENKA